MTGRDMTDEAVRAELERINIHELWDHCVKEEPDCDDTLFRDILNALRLLAESQRALGEIVEINNDEDLTFRESFDKIDVVARTAWKGGKS